MRKSVLLVAQDFPYPLNYAGPVDSFNKIRALHANGFNVYLVATTKGRVENESIGVMSEYCVQSHVIHRSYNVTNLFSLLPFQMKSRINEIEIHRICMLMKSVKFDTIICDGYYVIEVVKKIAQCLNIEDIYLRVNNNEISYFISLAKSSRNVLKKIYYVSDAIRFYLHEKFVLPKIKLKGMLHVSHDEKMHYESKFPEFNHFFLPAAVDVNNMRAYVKRDRKNVLYVGSLFMPNNIEGLIWYIEHIHDALTHRYADYILNVAGNVRGADCKQLDDLFSTRTNISFVKSPPDLTLLYDEAMIFINPMLNGAGVKLKTLNAICAGLPVVSTIVGNEGTGLVNGKHIMVATEANSFFEHIVLLIENEDMRHALVMNGQKFLAHFYNQSAALERILVGSLEPQLGVVSKSDPTFSQK